MPPTAKQRGRKSAVGVLAERAVQGDVSTAVLRQLAAAKYISSPSSPTLVELKRDPAFSGVRLETLQRWCSEDDWVDQREAFYESLRREIQRQAGNRLIAARIQEFDNYSKLQDLLFDKMRTTVIAANSLEGMTGAVVRLGEFLDKLRTAIMADIVPTSLDGTTSQAAPQMQLRSGLSADEAREAAMAILRKRREQRPVVRRQPVAAAGGNGDASEEEDSESTV